MGLWDDLVAAAHGLTADKPQVTNSGRVEYINPEGDRGTSMDYLGHLLKSTGQTFGEAITPSLNPVGRGGQGPNVQSGRQWLRQNLGLENRGGEGLLEAGLKGAGEGVLNLLVPETSADLEGAALGEASGALLGGGLQSRRAIQEALAARRAQSAAKTSATQKLQRGAASPQNVWQGPVGGGRAPGYHTQRMENRRLNLGGEEKPRLPNEAIPSGQKYKGPRPSETDLQQFETGGRVDRGIPGPTPQHPVNRAVGASERGMNRLDSHQLNMQRYRMAEEQAQKFFAGEVSSDDIARMDPETRKLLEKHIWDTRVERAPVASPEEIMKVNGASGGAAPTPGPGSMPQMGTPQDLADLLYSEDVGRTAGQMNRIVDMGQEGANIMGFMQDLLKSNPSMTLQEFLSTMRQGGGRYGARPLPF